MGAINRRQRFNPSGSGAGFKDVILRTMIDWFVGWVAWLWVLFSQSGEFIQQNAIHGRLHNPTVAAELSINCQLIDLHYSSYSMQCRLIDCRKRGSSVIILKSIPNAKLWIDCVVLDCGFNLV